MAKNEVQRGDILTVTAPATVVSGQGVLVGAMFGVALDDATTGSPVAIAVEGVWTLPKAAEGINEGVRVFWNSTNGNVTTTAGSNTCIGWAVGPGNYSSGATTINVKLGRPNAAGA